MLLGRTALQPKLLQKVLSRTYLSTKSGLEMGERFFATMGTFGLWKSLPIVQANLSPRRPKNLRLCIRASGSIRGQARNIPNIGSFYLTLTQSSSRLRTYP